MEPGGRSYKAVHLWGKRPAWAADLENTIESGGPVPVYSAGKNKQFLKWSELMAANKDVVVKIGPNAGMEFGKGYQAELTWYIVQGP